MPREIDHKAVNNAKRFLATLEREERILTGLVARAGHQLWGVNALYFLVLFDFLLIAALVISFYFIISSRQSGTDLEIYLMAFAITALLLSAFRVWLYILKIRRINKVAELLGRTIKEERRETENLIGNGEN